MRCRSNSPQRRILLGLALSAALTLVGVEPSSASSDLRQAQEAFAAERWEEAVDALRQVLERTPDLAHAHFLLGLSLSELGRGEEALESIHRAVELDADTPQYALHLAKLQLRRDRPEEAEAALAGLSPGTLDPPLDAAFAQLLAKAASESSAPGAADRLREAIQELGDSEATLPLWRALGSVSAAERPTRAYDAHLRAFDLGARPADGQRALEIAARLAAEADGRERIAWSKRAADVADRLLAAEESPDTELLLLAGRLRLQAGQPELAEPPLERAARLADAGANPSYELARCALARGDVDAALSFLEVSLAKASSAEQERRAWSLRANVLHEQGRLREAAEAYQRAGRSDTAELLKRAADAEDDRKKAQARCDALRAEVERALDEARGVVGPRDLAELEARGRRRLEEAGCGSNGT